ncbi:MAG: hypothetical protein IV100_03565 [Myxococcales bacterium]|nr:hypothetical protein [Myxococcales bacterium]
MTGTPYITYSGHCLDCGRLHELSEAGESREAVSALLSRLAAAKVDPSPKVIGALVGRDTTGERTELVAISGFAWPNVPIAFAPGLRDHTLTAEAEAETLRRIAELDAALASVRASLLELDGDTLRHAMAARASTRLAESARRRAERHDGRAALAEHVGGDPGGGALRLIDDEARRERQRERDEARRDREELDHIERSEDRLNATRLALLSERRQVSAALMAQIFDAYHLMSLGGRNASIAEALRTTGHGRAVPTGTGDCAAPRLIAEAGRLGLTQVSLSEVWWAPSEGRHGRPVGPCAERCQPILGFLLCPAPDVNAPNVA